MAKGEKRKLPRVKARVGQSGKEYSPSGFRFAFVSSPEEGRQQATALNSCRENVNNGIRTHICGQHGKDAPVDRSRLRLLVAGPSKQSKDKLFNAKAMLNLCEDLAGWKRSTISTVKHENYDNAWLITGPGEWMMAPQLLSACTLILRVCTQAAPVKAETYDEFEKEMRRLNKQKDTGDCRDYLGLYWDKMRVLLSEAKKIFEGLDVDKLWGVDYEGSFGWFSGIYQFWKNNDQYDPTAAKARKRFRELVQQHNRRRK
jgi:hypothetical protein